MLGSKWKKWLLLLLFVFPSVSAWSASDNSSTSHAGFVSRFLDSIRDKFHLNDNNDEPADPTKRRFMQASGSAILTVGMGAMGTELAKLGEISGVPSGWLERMARLRNGRSLDASGLKDYLKALQKELAQTTNPTQRRILLSRIQHGNKTLAIIGKILDPVTGAVRDRTSVADTRSDPSALQDSPKTLQRQAQKIKRARQQLIRNRLAETTFLESMLAAEDLLTPILRNRLNVQMRFTKPEKEEFVIALDNEDEQVFVKYRNILLALKDSLKKYPDSANQANIYRKWVDQRLEFTDIALQLLEESKQYFSCKALL